MLQGIGAQIITALLLRIRALHDGCKLARHGSPDLLLHGWQETFPSRVNAANDECRASSLCFHHIGLVGVVFACRLIRGRLLQSTPTQIKPKVCVLEVAQLFGRSTSIESIINL